MDVYVAPAAQDVFGKMGAGGEGEDVIESVAEQRDVIGGE